MADYGYESGAVAVASPHSAMRPGTAAMSRPQVGIERLPTRRLSNEPRESMNCKSCRKRKIKCNRLRPSCEACQVFQCACIYDAVPKKRGPKTDVLEALLKRVDGLEARLKEKKTDPEGPATDDTPAPTADGGSSGAQASAGSASNAADAGDGKTSVSSTSADITAEARARDRDIGESAVQSPSPASEPSPPGIQTDALLDTYFMRSHGKPFHILDESTLRQRLQLNQVPMYLMHAIYAVAARYTPHPSGNLSAVKLSEGYATRARGEIDTDEPSLDALQALLLLVMAFTACGRGKKAYMLLTSAVGMAMALELHREMDMAARITPVEREMRRRLFWTCYLLDRFMACGSKRPSLVGDKAILLRLPSWSPSPASLPIDGEYFQSSSSLQYLQGGGTKKSQGSTGMLIDISRILGITNRYLAAGGVKGDSHFPWHSLSNLSKIRQDLDVWASGAADIFTSIDNLFGQSDSTVLVLSKLIYHLVHCLIYRPFLPIDLSELAGSGQHQSWQIDATNMCFMHANAIAELVELGRQTGSIEWPAFVGYCICTAGTVHIHGAHYSRNSVPGETNVFASSADFLSREMQQLSELRCAWASVQHQRETLQGIYNAHSELAKSFANNPMRYSPVFHLEDFFDRYANIGGPGGKTFSFDAANLSLSDVVIDFAADTYTGHDLYAPRVNGGGMTDPAASVDRPNLKRKSTATSSRRRTADGRNLSISNISTIGSGGSHGLRALSPVSHPHRPPSFSTAAISASIAASQQTSPGLMQSPTTLGPHHDLHEQQAAHLHGFSESLNDAASIAAAAAAGFTLGPHPHAHLHAQQHSQHHNHSQQHAQHPHPHHAPMPTLATHAFSPPYNFGHLGQPSPSPPSSSSPNGGGTHQEQQHQHQHHQAGPTAGGGYDPMFGGVPTNAFSSPAPWGDGRGSSNGGGSGNGGAGGGAGGGAMVVAPSPGGNGSTSTGPGEEKDPFLSLLEQLAESESIREPGSEFDFFLGMPSTGG